LSREYAVDPLEILFVHEVMRTNIVALPASAPAAELAATLHSGHERRGQLLYPVVDGARRCKLLGMMALEDLRRERVLRIHRPFGRRAPEEQDA
jgi:chloride channel protein, CIC family